MGVSSSKSCTGAAPGKVMAGDAIECALDAKKQESPVDAWKRLEEGNRRFSEWREEELFYGIARQANPDFRTSLVGGQKPFACVVTCADSRVDPNLTFGCGLGQLFVIKNAGNMAGYNTIASVEYAVDQLHVPIVIFLGHESCGAVSVTIDRVVSDEDAGVEAKEDEAKIDLAPLRIKVKHQSSGSASELAQEILHARTLGKAQLHASGAASSPLNPSSGAGSGSGSGSGSASKSKSKSESGSGSEYDSGGDATPTPKSLGVAAAVSRHEKGVDLSDPSDQEESTHSKFLDNLVAGITPAVRAVQQVTREQGLPGCTCKHAEGPDGHEVTRVDKPADFIRMCVEQNAILQCQETLALSAAVRRAVKAGRCQIVPAYYSLKTGAVTRLELPDESHGYKVEAGSAVYLGEPESAKATS